ncbi:hypothetical protein BKA69DRAFT_1038683 [Paraphysoderma sedebokerense]|nr:hypothetical protein BKA69DRAFT_1038683 [Paraphysoderma sedebokerense]
MSNSSGSPNKEEEFFDSEETSQPTLNGSTNRANSDDTVNTATGEEAAEVPAQHKSAFLQFIKTLASFTGDLSQLTCPAFLLSGVSLLEYSAHWVDHPELFAAIPRVKDPAERMVAVARWFTSSLFGSYLSRCVTGTEKKPFNPVLGELFLGKWPTDSKRNLGETTMVVEQAFHFDNKEAGIYMNGHCGQKTKFKTASIKVEQTGRIHITLADGLDEYLVSYPELFVRGLLSGQMFVELAGTSRITSRSGFNCDIEYIPKPWFSGEYHHMKGSIYKIGEEKKSLYTISGRWPHVTYITETKSNETTVLFDADTSPIEEPSVKPIAEQNDIESRKLWQKVADALNSQNYSTATKEKTDIEEYQRSMRKERAANGEVWNPKYFKFVEDDESLHHFGLGSAKGSQASLNASGSKKKKDDERNLAKMDYGAWIYVQDS